MGVRQAFCSVCSLVSSRSADLRCSMSSLAELCCVEVPNPRRHHAEEPSGHHCPGQQRQMRDGVGQNHLPSLSVHAALHFQSQTRWRHAVCVQETLHIPNSSTSARRLSKKACTACFEAASETPRGIIMNSFLPVISYLISEELTAGSEGQGQLALDAADQHKLTAASADHGREQTCDNKHAVSRAVEGEDTAPPARTGGTFGERRRAEVVDVHEGSVHIEREIERRSLELQTAVTNTHIHTAETLEDLSAHALRLLHVTEVQQHQLRRERLSTQTGSVGEGRSSCLHSDAREIFTWLGSAPLVRESYRDSSLSQLGPHSTSLAPAAWKSRAHSETHRASSSPSSSSSGWNPNAPNCSFAFSRLTLRTPANNTMSSGSTITDGTAILCETHQSTRGDTINHVAPEDFQSPTFGPQQGPLVVKNCRTFLAELSCCAFSKLSDKVKEQKRLFDTSPRLISRPGTLAREHGIPAWDPRDRVLPPSGKRTELDRGRMSVWNRARFHQESDPRTLFSPPSSAAPRARPLELSAPQLLSKPPGTGHCRGGHVPEQNRLKYGRDRRLACSPDSGSIKDVERQGKHNCFKPRELHLLTDQDLNQSSSGSEVPHRIHGIGTVFVRSEPELLSMWNVMETRRNPEPPLCPVYPCGV
ncbi:hypothetical protein DNTS_025266 [Danionella cerebrum]|uniref:Uncharacterized protein n=1 Tax=Danionella cerebrum TaxID=2873325 RepID=A0A553Q1G7_9TELE|nr:hypothetical protein DNTS_025266 [Danionella translucida]